MLTLNRRPGKKIYLSTETGGLVAVVTVLRVHGNQVRIGIEAPDDVVVDREEIHQRRIAGIPHPKAGPA